ATAAPEAAPARAAGAAAADPAAVPAGAPTAGTGVMPVRAPVLACGAPAGPEPAGRRPGRALRARSPGPRAPPPPRPPPPAAPPDIPRSAPTATAPWSAVWRKPPPPEASATCPVVQVNSRIRTGSASRDKNTIVKPISTVRGSLPVPIMVNAVAYTIAAAGL